MRLKNIPGSREAVAASKYVIPEEDALLRRPWKVFGKWSDIFGNSSPIHLEIGMGKGAFLMEKARLFPDINFVGVEKFSSVLLRAVQKEEAENLPNIRFIRMDAEYLANVFAEDEVDRIYLNFSDPWPKERHAKRRLTSGQFLRRYEKFLKAGGLVEFKTDNESLFDFSLRESVGAGWTVESATRNLYESDMALGNIQTEYEKKFASCAQPIYKMIIRRPSR